MVDAELVTGFVNVTKDLHELLKMYAAAQEKALGQENKNKEQQEEIEIITKTKQDNKVAKSYNLVCMLTGSGPIAAYNDDDMPNISQPKFYGGSKILDKETSEKVRKSYELMRLMTSQ
jgi:hypothetical protein